MENPRWQRALLLHQQSRDELAEAELRGVLTEEPDHARAHALLARLLSRREQFSEATGEATQAIHLSPEDPFTHQSLAEVMLRANRFPEAGRAAQEAIALDPDWSSSYALLAQVHLKEHRWREALAAAQKGLEVDPQDSTCANLTAMALVQLGEKEQAKTLIDAALRENPEDSLSHTNQGWTLLHQGKPREALEHFREALRLDPGEDSARRGIVEALKARNIVYRWMLGYFFWMARMNPTVRWGVILGGYFGSRVLRAAAKAVPALAPFILPLIVIYVTFVVLTWIAVPIGNLMLRLNRYGRLALSREETITSNAVGLCVGAALLFLGAAAVFQNFSLLFGALACGLLIPPISGIYQCQQGWPRNAMMAITAVMIGIGLVLAIVIFAGTALVRVAPPAEPFLMKLAQSLPIAYVVLAIGSQFAVNALAGVQVRR